MKVIKIKEKHINNKNSKIEKFLNFFKLDILISIYIIMLPILDSSSYIFRNLLKMNFSPSTFLRPIYLMFIIVIMFFKSLEKNKEKYKTYLSKFILYILLTFVYTAVHMYIFKKGMQKATIQPPIEELRYIIYYFFNSYIFLSGISYIKDSKNINDKKEKNHISISIILSAFLYLSILYISFFTKTASYTYMDSKTGYKGYFESGNIISNILVLIQILLLIIFKNTRINKIKDIKNINTDKKEKKIYKNIFIKILTCILILLNTIYMIFLLGTRTGKYGSILCICMYTIFEIFSIIKKYIDKKKINKNKTKKEIIKIVIINIAIIILLLIILVLSFNIMIKKIKVSSDTRRQYLENNQKELVDEEGKILSVTQEIHNLNKRIKNGEISEEFLSKNEQKALIETEKIAKEKGLVGHSRREAQTIYNFNLVKNEKNLLKILFGKGHLITYGEMVLERELLSCILDFGIIGFILFILPFLMLLLYEIYLILYDLVNRKGMNVNTQKLMSVFGIFFAFCLSYFAGAIFYPMSSAFLICLLFYYI